MLRWFEGLKRFAGLFFSAMFPERDVALGKNSSGDLIGSKSSKVYIGSKCYYAIRSKPLELIERIEPFEQPFIPFNP